MTHTKGVRTFAAKVRRVEAADLIRAPGREKNVPHRTAALYTLNASGLERFLATGEIFPPSSQTVIMKRALILVDLQPDFMPGGPLAVPFGDNLIEIANRLAKRRDIYDLVVATQDFHPPDHRSFAANHPGEAVYDMVELRGLQQVLWPTHCVQGTPGVEIHPGLERARLDAIVQKGKDAEVDSYSGFLNNDRQTPTGLKELLKARDVTDLDVCGLAGDYCVTATALDGLYEGFNVRLLAFAIRSVNLQPGDEAKAFAKVEAAGGTIIHQEADLAA